MVGEGDEGAEPRLAADELPGAVDRVHDPHRRVAVQRVGYRRVRVHGLLADHDGAGEQGRQRRGQVLLGEAIRGRHQVVRTALLDDLVRGELPEARHDLGGCGLADRLLHGSEVAIQKVIDHASSQSHPSDIPPPTR
jgi:hypothetical protein